MVTMVTMIRTLPLDINDFDSRCDDADVTETSDPLGGFKDYVTYVRHGVPPQPTTRQQAAQLDHDTTVSWSGD